MVLPLFETPSGYLPPGQHHATWEEVVDRFGWTQRRRRLLDGIAEGISTHQLETIVITNEFQYHNTQRLLAEFEALVETLQGTADQAQRPKLRSIEIAAAESQAESFRTEIVEYEHLRSGAVNTITASTMLGIAELLIKARVARGWSQTQLAEALGMAVQQIQRYEATNYASASLARLSDIATALNIEINETAHIRGTA